MRLAPGGDVVVVVAVGQGGADHQQQHLRQRVADPAHVARILDRGEVVEQNREAGLPRGRQGGCGHGTAPNRTRRANQPTKPLSPESKRDTIPVPRADHRRRGEHHARIRSDHRRPSAARPPPASCRGCAVVNPPGAGEAEEPPSDAARPGLPLAGAARGPAVPHLPPHRDRGRPHRIRRPSPACWSRFSWMRRMAGALGHRPVPAALTSCADRGHGCSGAWCRAPAWRCWRCTLRALAPVRVGDTIGAEVTIARCAPPRAAGAPSSTSDVRCAEPAGARR